MTCRFQSFIPCISTSMLRPFAAACLVAVASLSWTGWAAAVDCSTGDVVLRSQGAVDTLGAKDCDTVPGSLIIQGSTANSITSLQALTNITTVGNKLQIGGSVNNYNVGNDSLTTLDGLNNITSVAGLAVLYNDILTDLDGLSSLDQVTSDISINGNRALTDIDGLANVTRVRSIAIGGGSGSVLGNGNPAGNPALTNLDGLANISSVAGNLSVSSNYAVTNLDGLVNLTSVGGHLFIYNNFALTNLAGLANISSVAGNLSVSSNYALTSCEGVALLLGWSDGPPDDTVAGDITIGNNGSGCDSIEQILASVSGPTKPTITSGSAIAGGITLKFSSSTTTDTLFPITGYEAACIGSSADFSEAPAAALLDNTPVTRTLNVSGYDPVSVLSDIEVDIDITHSDPADLYITLTTPQGTELVLWDKNSAGSEDLAGTFPTTLMPIDSLSNVSDEALDGVWTLLVEDQDVGPIVREGVLNAWGLRLSPEANKATGADSPITVSGITRGRDYSCTVAPVTGLGTLPVSDAVTAKSDFPSTPSVTSTDYEDGTIRLTVSVADNGGADITEYSASCTDGTSTFTGTSSTPTIVVTGLTNGTAYTCNASATNSVGSSGASVSTDSITPEALPTGLPIWLLYEATKQPR